MPVSRKRRPLPIRVVTGAWAFVNPRLKAGRIPYTRTMLAMQIVAAAIFVGYTLVKKDVQLPFSDKPYYVDVLLPDAKGLNPAKEPAVGVAGVPVGKVVSATVDPSGQARVRMRMNADLRGKIFRNATAFVRPTSILQTLIVSISPGDPREGALPDGQVIPASRTGTFVSIDQLTGVLDPGTQAQVRVLLDEATQGLTGRDEELRKIFSRLGRLTDGTTTLARALAERRKLLSRLTADLDTLFNTLGDRGRQLARTVALGNRTLQVTANRAPQLSQATRELAPTLRQARRALDASAGLSATLVPALQRLNPVADRLAPTAEQLQALAPEFDRLIGKGRQVITAGRTPVAQLAGGLKGQDARVRNDQIPALQDLGHLSALLRTYRYGVAETAENISGATSTARNAGIAALFNIVDLNANPLGLGMTAAQARERVGGTSRLAYTLARALEVTCRENTVACILRTGIPGLPTQAVARSAKGGGR